MQFGKTWKAVPGNILCDAHTIMPNYCPNAAPRLYKLLLQNMLLSENFLTITLGTQQGNKNKM